MTTLISTLALSNPVTAAVPWDLYVDNLRNIATNTQAAAVAQDAASAIKVFSGEIYLDTTQGIPYLSELFVSNFGAPVVGALLEQAALSVPNVVTAQSSNVAVNNRSVTGTVNILDVNGQASGVIL